MQDHGAKICNGSMTPDDDSKSAAADAEAGARLGLTPKQGYYLVRYVLGRLAIERITFVFLAKWVLAALGVLCLVFGGGSQPDWIRPFGVALLVLFGLVWLVQLAVIAVVRRLAVPRRYRPAFDALESAASDWWPRLSAELRRVGLPSGPFGITGLAWRLARRRLRRGEREALREVRLSNVVPGADLRRARRLFDDADAHH